MQTFLPYSDFKKSLKCLDYRRLGKQRVEAFQLLCANGDEWALAERTRRTGKTNAPKGWRNHPAAIMWRGYNDALREYYNNCIDEWVKRGYNNTMVKTPTSSAIEYPYWLGDKNFHASHRSNLLRKNPGFYSSYGWLERPDIEYVWPKEENRIGVIG